MVDAVAEEVIAEAFRKIGSPYVLGTEGPTRFDCSGLMYWIFKETGNEALIGFTRRKAAGYARWFADRGKFSRSLSSAERGDLICYSENGDRVSHIGIYLGDGTVISALVPPFGVKRHGVTNINVPFYGVCLVDYPTNTGRTGPDDTDSEDDDPESFVITSTPRWLGDISILYEGVDITADVEFATARFVTEAGGAQGEAYLRVKDKEHAYAPGYFHTGGTLELYINDRREWDGWAMVVDREWAFPVDNTEQPNETPRYWVIEGVDRNFLFQRRFHLDKADPANPDFGTYPAGVSDRAVVLDMLANYTTLEDDELDLVSGINEVGPIDPFVAIKAFGLGMKWGEAMRKIALFNGAIYYIDPDRVVRYVDDQIDSAPFALSDVPEEGEIGYRDLVINYNAVEMYNEAFLWGAGVGSPEPAFAHVRNEDAISDHGLFQYGEIVQGMYTDESVERRADTLINGSPQHRRGHKDDVVRISCTIFQPGLRIGQGVSFRSAAWDFGDYSFDPNDIISPPTPPGSDEFERLLWQIGKIESNNNYTRQNSRSFAYGRWQVMPGNWRVWGPLALGLPRSSGVASRDLDPSDWVPEPTPANQDAVVRWRMGQMYRNQGDVRRVAASWRSGSSVGSSDPSTWSRGTLLYVNHATVPLGYPPTTNDTILAPLTDPVQSRVDYDVTDDSDDVYPVRRMEITFPTPNSVRYNLLLSHSLDAAWAYQEPYPSPEDPSPIGDFPITEVIAIDGPWFVGPQDNIDAYFPIGEFAVSRTTGVRTGSAGQDFAGGGIYSSAGIEEGFAANVPYPETSCGLGPGAWKGVEHAEAWYEISATKLIVALDTAGNQVLASMCDINATYPFELEIRDEFLIEGSVPSIQVRIADGPPTVGSYGEGSEIAVLTCSDQGSYGPDRPATLAPAVIGPGTLQEGKWLVVSPNWQAFETDLACDEFYYAPGEACNFRGPRCTGANNSGVLRLAGAAFGGPIIHLTPLGWPGDGWGEVPGQYDWVDTPYPGVENGSPTYWTDGLYRTMYPYLSGSLEITWQGLTLSRGVDYFETDPENGIFTLAQVGSGENTITVRYMVPAGSAPTGLMPGEPGYVAPTPGNPAIPTGSGRVYRPRPQSQFGWGTPYDGQNCNMAASAMALDRHTLGAFSAISGTPRSTPPNHRFYSGRLSLNRIGTSLSDAANAWDAGWDKTLLTPGPVSWEYFVNAVANGRGAILHGLPTVLPSSLRKTNWQDAHAIYINEILPDGSFWGIDPVYREPLLYPESALRAYATSLHGFRNVVTSAYTRITPRM